MDRKPKLSLETRVSLTDEQVSCELEGEVVVLSLKSGEYYGLNPVAAAVWSHLESPQTVLELRDRLLNEFAGITADQCADELLALIADLLEMELISVS